MSMQVFWNTISIKKIRMLILIAEIGYWHSDSLLTNKSLWLAL